MAHPDPTLAPLLAGYVGGALPRPLHALVGAHLEMRPAAHAFVNDLEAVAGLCLDGMAPSSIGARAPVLERIWALAPDGAPEPATRPAVPPRAGATGFPPSLTAYLGRGLDAVPWRFLMPGVRFWRVGDDEGYRVRLYRLGRSVALPGHTHTGLEAILVLDGAFRDETGLYAAGDVLLADEEVEHCQVADPEAGCICYAVFEGPIRPTGRFTRYLAPFVR